MNIEHVEQLHRDHPHLMGKNETNSDIEFAIGDGWYDLVNNLFTTIEKDVTDAETRLKTLRDNEADTASINEAEAAFNTAVAALPTILQVKEKFGLLRMYVSNASPEVAKSIEEAEKKSGRICIDCGKPGRMRYQGWHRCTCNQCESLTL